MTAFLLTLGGIAAASGTAFLVAAVNSGWDGGASVIGARVVCWLVSRLYGRDRHAKYDELLGNLLPTKGDAAEDGVRVTDPFWAAVSVAPGAFAGAVFAARVRVSSPETRWLDHWLLRAMINDAMGSAVIAVTALLGRLTFGRTLVAALPLLGGLLVVLGFRIRRQSRPARQQRQKTDDS